MSCHLLCFAFLFLGCHPDFPTLFPHPDASPATNTALVFLLPVLIPLLVYYTRSTKFSPYNYVHTSHCVSIHSKFIRTYSYDMRC